MLRRKILFATLAGGVAVLASGCDLISGLGGGGGEKVSGGGSKIKVSKAWGRASRGPIAAAYLTIENSGGGDDRLIAVSADVGRRVAMHTTEMDGDVARMREVPTVEIPAGQTVMLKPGGLHLMLMGAKEGLAEGAVFNLTLTFEKAGKVEVKAHVLKAGAMTDMKHTN